MTKNKYYPNVEQNLDIPKMEQSILEYWENNKIFEQSIKNRDNKKDYVFYDGPPFASGLPHYGHLLAGYIKDTFARYHTMLGEKCERMFGWDCHGLPAEMGVEKETGISGRRAIEEYGIDKFNELCRQSVQKYVNEWKYYVNRMGRWVDFDNGYKTMDLKYMESTLWVFKQLYDKGLLYEDYRVMPYSWTCQTPLSNFETKQDNSYRRKEDKAVTIKFKISPIPQDIIDLTNDFKDIKELSLQEKIDIVTDSLFSLINRDIETKEHKIISIRDIENQHIKNKVETRTNVAEKNKIIIAIKNIENIISNAIYVETKRVDVSKNSKVSTIEYKETVEQHLIFSSRIKIDDNIFSVILTTNEIQKKLYLYEVYTKKLSVSKRTTDNLASIINKNEINVNNLYALAWTTTPWTLPSNVALTVNKDITYILVKTETEHLILGKNALEKYKKEIQGEIVAEFKGSELLGLEYEPLFDYLLELKEVKECDRCFTILEADYVTDTDGVGIVHTASGFGEDDNNTCKKVGIPTICPVDDAGKFIEPIRDFIGMQVFDTNEPIIIKLKEQGKWLKTEQYIHDYPHCWRTDAPLIYRALPSWYVKVESVKDLLTKNNENINWIPEHIKHGRFGKWLEGARDWSITRNRFWGCPVPVWKSNDPKYPRIDVYGSIADLEKDFNTKITDLHRPYIDNLTRPNPDDPTGKSMMVRVTDVMDCWFESGSMPYGQHHYPFENKDWFEKHFPADFITEGDGQLRGWFYVLHVLGSALFNRATFKNCISYGIIVDETGKKLSKRLRNYVDPMEVCNMYGSDALRWFMMKSPALKGEEIRIEKTGKDIKDSLRMYIKPILNSYNFFCMYANSDGIKAELIEKSTNIMDTYILSKMKIAVQNIKKAMDDYTPSVACKESEEFFETLNNWYIRRNKERFWKSEIDNDKKEAYNTLYTILNTMSKSLASLLPFTTEFIWRGLNV